MITDPIADLLTRLRNAIQAGKRFVQVKNSRVKHGMVQVMHHSGYLADYRVEDPDSWKSTLHIGLKYNHKLQKNAITHLKTPKPQNPKTPNWFYKLKLKTNNCLLYLNLT